MAYFDAFTANLFRTDTRRRGVICPFGRRVYAVSPEDERRIKRAVTWFYAAMLVVVVVVTSVVMPNWLWVLLFVPLLVAVYFLLMAFLARSLVPLEVSPADLTPVTPLGVLDETLVRPDGGPYGRYPPLLGVDGAGRLGAFVVGCGVLRLGHRDTRCAAVEAAALSAA